MVVSLPLSRELGAKIAGVEGSRWVPGSESSAARDLLQSAFPATASERRVAVVLQSADVLSDEVKQLLGDLEAELKALQDTGEISSYTTPLEIYRRVTMVYIQEAHRRLTEGLQQIRRALAELDRVRQEVRAATGGRLPESQVAELALRELLARVPAEQAALVQAAAQLGPEASDQQILDLLVTLTARTEQLEGDRLWLLSEVARLGTDPSDAGVLALAEAAVRRFPLHAFPVAVPADILNQLVSADREVALVQITFPERPLFQPQLDLARELVGRIVAERGAPVTFHVTSEKAIGRDMVARLEQDNRKMELFAAGLVVVVLLIFFRSPVATVLTLVLIQLAMTVSKALLHQLVAAGVSLSPFTLPVMTFVMLGAGVDYSMILSERYYQERQAGRSKWDALHTALAHAGESVFFSGMTTLIAFGATTLSQLDFIRGLGIGGIAAILLVLAGALTLTPSFLMLMGDWFFWPVRPTAAVHRDSPLSRYLQASVRFTTKRPGLITLAFVLLLLPGLWILRSYDPMGHPLALSPDTDAKRGYQVVAAKWGDSWLMPTYIVAQLGPDQFSGDQLTPAARAAQRELVARLEQVEGVERVMALDQPFGTPLSEADQARLPDFVRRQFLAPSQRALLFSVVLKDVPFSHAANATVDRIRQVLAETHWPGATFWVGGSTQADRDYRTAMMTDFWRMVTFITIGVFVVLSLQLRSVVIPVRLILTIVLGNILAIAFLVVLFQWIRGVPITVEVPVMLVVLMMGLGLDYEIFLMTRVKEEVDKGRDEKAAVEQAVFKTGRVINYAGLLMAGVLASMTLSSGLTLQAYGAALAFAVLLDATILRMYLVPATVLLLNKYNWWFPFRRLPTGDQPVVAARHR